MVHHKNWAMLSIVALPFHFISRKACWYTTKIEHGSLAFLFYLLEGLAATEVWVTDMENLALE
jgi:hypothetical protein